MPCRQFRSSADVPPMDGEAAGLSSASVQFASVNKRGRTAMQTGSLRCKKRLNLSANWNEVRLNLLLC
ncbi:MAG: hypothetical protein LBM04_00880 [Opitutaceae bacterium]|nr:hypothetical protein [Opitutaceae bacterium]